MLTCLDTFANLRQDDFKKCVEIIKISFLFKLILTMLPAQAKLTCKIKVFEEMKRRYR
jgi:hypothetical protein